MTTPTTLKASRMWYRVCIGFTGSNDVLVELISATAIALHGALLQESKTDDDFFAEWEFGSIHNAERFRRMLDQFEPPARINDEAAWSVVLTQLYYTMLHRSLSTWEEDTKGTAWNQTLI